MSRYQLPPGPGRPKGYKHTVVARQRLRANRLMILLYQTAMGEREMTATQISAAIGFLRKVIPDLKAVEHSGEIKHRHVEELSDAELIEIIARSGRERTAETPLLASDDGSVH